MIATLILIIVLIILLMIFDKNFGRKDFLSFLATLLATLAGVILAVKISVAQEVEKEEIIGLRMLENSIMFVEQTIKMEVIKEKIRGGEAEEAFLDKQSKTNFLKRIDLFEELIHRDKILSALDSKNYTALEIYIVQLKREKINYKEKMTSLVGIVMQLEKVVDDFKSESNTEKLKTNIDNKDSIENELERRIEEFEGQVVIQERVQDTLTSRDL